MKNYYVYILSSQPRGTLYTGVTSDLKKRVFEHRNKLVKGFAERHDATNLVWYEVHRDVEAALTREKQIKKWNRIWKIEIVENINPLWEDLYEGI